MASTIIETVSFDSEFFYLLVSKKQLTEMGLQRQVGIGDSFVKYTLFIIYVNHGSLETVACVRTMKKLSNIQYVNLQVKDQLRDLNVEVNMKPLF